nr:MAG TPA: hypothetical protein [Caudoviricetes sp.]
MFEFTRKIFLFLLTMDIKRVPFKSKKHKGRRL